MIDGVEDLPADDAVEVLGRDPRHREHGLLAPDGETQVSRGGRSPSMVFGGIEGLLGELETLTERYPAKTKPRSSRLRRAWENQGSRLCP